MVRESWEEKCIAIKLLKQMHLLLGFAYTPEVFLLVLLLQINILYVFQLKHGQGVVGRIMHCKKVAKADASMLVFAYAPGFFLLVLSIQLNILYIFQLKHGQGVVGTKLHSNQVAKTDASVVGFCLHTKGLATGPLAPKQYFVRFSTEMWSGSHGKNDALRSSC